MLEHELNEFLEKLGLTEYEAKTLNALFSLKEAEAPEISRNAQVPKTRVYDVLDRLTQKKLIIEIHGRPKKYMAIEPSEVFDKLISYKKNEIRELETKALELKEKVMLKSTSTKNEKVMKVKQKSDFLKILQQEVESANHSIHGLTQLETTHLPLQESIKKVKEKNVEVKLITQITENTKSVAKKLSESGAIIRDFEHGIHAYVIDNSKVILALSDFKETKPEYHFTIWPENKALANALIKYFNEAWENGKEI
ncbi:MAG: helix-turn-helix domain-containing protein [Candidatus Diapherotrites archaeon]